MAIPITWQLQVTGAENVKARLSELNDQFERGQITTEQYASGLRSVNRDARVLSNTQTIQRNIFLATHPVLNNLSRAMSIFGSVNRAVMNSLNTINIAMIALNTNSSGVAQATADLAQIRREIATELEKAIPNEKILMDLYDRERVAIARLAEETQNRANQMTSAWISVFAAFSNVATAIILSIPKIIPLLRSLTAVSWASVGPWVALAAVIAGLTLMYLDFLNIEPFSTWATQLNNIFEQVFGFRIPNVIDISARALADFFVIMLPQYFATAIAQLIAFTAIFNLGWGRFWNGVITILEKAGNLILKSITSLLNGVISLANQTIKGLNSIPGVSIPLIPKLTFKPIEFGRLGESEFTNEGNSGIIPGAGLRPGISGKGAEKAAQNNVVINIQGSLLTENDLTKIFDKWLKNQLLGKGF